MDNIYKSRRHTQITDMRYQKRHKCKSWAQDTRKSSIHTNQGHIPNANKNSWVRTKNNDTHTNHGHTQITGTHTNHGHKTKIMATRKSRTHTRAHTHKSWTYTNQGHTNKTGPSKLSMGTHKNHGHPQPKDPHTNHGHTQNHGHMVTHKSQTRP